MAIGVDSTGTVYCETPSDERTASSGLPRHASVRYRQGVKVQRWNRERHGPLNEAKLRHRLEELGYSVVRQSYPPGTSLPPHTHQQDKADAVLAGRLRIAIAGERVELGPGDLIEIPRGWQHAVEVVGNRTVIALDGVKIVPA
ncbi:MAG: cupin domain-containing protein [Acidobacteriota bacterium]|jgi:quercetin dioxygenase-like cupin family protein